MSAGVLTDPVAPSSFGAWIHYVGKNHVGAISFLIADFFLFFGVFALTVVQASQVCCCSLIYWFWRKRNFLSSVVLTHFLSLLFFFLRQIARNITTNEMANVMRYSYLRGPGGRFRNPYDHGIKKNCSDFLINGYNEDVEVVEELGQSEEGVGMMHMTRNSNLANGDSHSHSEHATGTGNGHHIINVNSNNSNSKTHHGHVNGHVHSSNCSHANQGKTRNDSTPVGLGLGLGRNPRSVAPSS